MTTASKGILAVDSDGCVLNAMEMKHEQCFTPAIIDTWGLQAIAPTVTKHALRINLFSRSRGVNRFEALSQLFHILGKRLPDARAAGVPDPSALDRWIASTGKLSEGSLRSALEGAPEGDKAELEKLLAWTQEVNRRIAQLPPPPAFAQAGSALDEALARGLRLMVVSSAARATIEHEFEAAGLAEKVTTFFGQEDGSKADVLRRLVAEVGNAREILMVGDALGDHDAAEAAGTLFFPIVPGAENSSWATLRDDVLPHFPGKTVPMEVLREARDWLLDTLPPVN